jgi:hypothetical protein
VSRRLTFSAAKLMMWLGLLIAFFLLWCGLRVSTAISKGALDRPVVCFDFRHLQQEVKGKVALRNVDYVLRTQVWAYYYDMKGRRLSHHLIVASAHWGWQLFWSEESRRDHYRTIARKLKPCDHALKFLEARGELTPAIRAFAATRRKALGLRESSP